MTAMINAMMAMVLVFTTSPSHRWARPRNALAHRRVPVPPENPTWAVRLDRIRRLPGTPIG